MKTKNLFFDLELTFPLKRNTGIILKRNTGVILKRNTGIMLALAIIATVSVFPQQLHAGRYYVGFSGTPAGATATYTGNNAGLISALSAAGAADTVFIAKGVTFYLDDELTVNEHIIGGCNPAGNGIDLSSRTTIGAANSVTSNMTVLDGNSLRRTLRSSKHRVATVTSAGVIENCLIRNGHARGRTNAVGDLSGYGGGILLDGGKLYNCIVRGNVAMNVEYKATNPSKGGGVYIISGEVLNCIVAFNMDDDGAGIDGNGGEVVNSTIARNSNTPSYARIEAGQYQPFNGSTTTSLLARYVYLDAFYIATTETTGGQYACFMAAIDYDGTNPPYLKSADASAILSAKMPTEVNYTGYPDGITVRDYTVWSQASTSGCTTPSTSCWNLLSNQTNLTSGGALTANSNIVWYPNTDKLGTTTTTGEERQRDNYPISYVSWYGSLCFSLWLGGSLPTESQWEYAARQKSNGSTDNSYYYAGATANSDAGLGAVGWYNGNSGSGGGTTTQHVHEVGKKTPTGKGLYDMSGNLWEWVVDPYASSYSTAAGTLTATSGKNLVSSNTGNAGTSSGAPLY
ncbi:MAG: formylglycine-generating enzyme family protein, partial [Bacteroidales bacterium]|nr:formylglycine-generating enzyme family protein [Bacteroidales bacterium]